MLRAFLTTVYEGLIAVQIGITAFKWRKDSTFARVLIILIVVFAIFVLSPNRTAMFAAHRYVG